MSSPLFVLAASATEASEWNHSISAASCTTKTVVRLTDGICVQQMLSATIPQKYNKTFFNKAAFENESWPDGRAKYVPNGLIDASV